MTRTQPGGPAGRASRVEPGRDAPAVRPGAPLAATPSPVAPEDPGARRLLGQPARLAPRPAGEGHVPAPVQLQLLRGASAPSVPSASSPARPAPSPAGEHGPLRAAFEALGATTVRGDVRLLEGNVESWAAIWHTLRAAPGGVDAAYFIFERDVFGMAYLGALLDRARQGHPVRLLLDATGGAMGGSAFTGNLDGQDHLQELAGAGAADVRIYHPLHRRVLRNVFERQRPWAGVASNHDKLLVTADAAVTGGRNVSGDYFSDPRDRRDVFRDADVRVRGAAFANQARRAFDREWDEEALHLRVRPDLLGNWVRRDLELIGAHRLMDLWMTDPRPLGAGERDALRRDPVARAEAAEALLARGLAALADAFPGRTPDARERAVLGRLAHELASQPELRGAHARFVEGEGAHRAVELKVLDRASAASREGEDELSRALAVLAAGARERIILQNPYVVLTRGMIEALKAAGERGVKIDLFTNSPDSTDSALTQAFFLEDWPRLLEAIPNLRIHVATGAQKFHAKTIQVDDRVAHVGSFNLDILSEQINGELGMVAWSPGLARDLRRSYEADLADPAMKVREYTIARDAAGRPVLDAAGEPVVTSGPADHMSWWSRVKYGALRWVVRQARRLPVLDALFHPAVRPARERPALPPA